MTPFAMLLWLKIDTPHFPRQTSWGFRLEKLVLQSQQRTWLVVILLELATDFMWLEDAIDRASVWKNKAFPSYCRCSTSNGHLGSGLNNEEGILKKAVVCRHDERDPTSAVHISHRSGQNLVSPWNLSYLSTQKVSPSMATWRDFGTQLKVQRSAKIPCVVHSSIPSKSLSGFNKYKLVDYLSALSLKQLAPLSKDDLLTLSQDEAHKRQIWEQSLDLKGLGTKKAKFAFYIDIDGHAMNVHMQRLTPHPEGHKANPHVSASLS